MEIENQKIFDAKTNTVNENLTEKYLNTAVVIDGPTEYNNAPKEAHYNVTFWDEKSEEETVQYYKEMGNKYLVNNLK